MNPFTTRFPFDFPSWLALFFSFLFQLLTALAHFPTRSMTLRPFYACI